MGFAEMMQSVAGATSRTFVTGAGADAEHLAPHEASAQVPLVVKDLTQLQAQRMTFAYLREGRPSASTYLFRIPAGSPVLLRWTSSYLDARQADGGRLVHVFRALVWCDAVPIPRHLTVDDSELIFLAQSA